MIKLICTFEGKIIREHAFDEAPVSIGRHPKNAIVIDNLAVSGFHAHIIKTPEGFAVEDAGSLNGTFLNNARVEGKAPLRSGDRVTIAKHTLIFLILEGGAHAGAGSDFIDRTLVLDTQRHRELSGKYPPPDPFEGNPTGAFKVLEGSAERSEYVLWGGFATIGSTKDAHIKMTGFFAPDIAAMVQRTAEGYFISPPETGKSPRINGMELPGLTALKEGDIIDLPGLKLKFFYWVEK